MAAPKKSTKRIKADNPPPAGEMPASRVETTPPPQGEMPAERIKAHEVPVERTEPAVSAPTEPPALPQDSTTPPPADAGEEGA